MIDFLFSETVMAKIGAALVAALVAIAFWKIILSMLGRFLRFWVKLPILAKVILPAVLIVYCLHGSMKNRGAFSVRSPNINIANRCSIRRSNRERTSIFHTAVKTKHNQDSW